MGVKMCSILSWEHTLFKVESDDESLLNFPYAVKGRNSDAAVAKKVSAVLHPMKDSELPWFLFAEPTLKYTCGFMRFKFSSD